MCPFDLIYMMLYIILCETKPLHRDNIFQIIHRHRTKIYEREKERDSLFNII